MTAVQPDSDGIFDVDVGNAMPANTSAFDDSDRFSVLQGSILQNSISAEDFSDCFSALKFVLISATKIHDRHKCI
jgi:hypothetical protein